MDNIRCLIKHRSQHLTEPTPASIMYGCVKHMAEKIPWSYKYPPCKMLEYTNRNSEEYSSSGYLLVLNHYMQLMAKTTN